MPGNDKDTDYRPNPKVSALITRIKQLQDAVRINRSLKTSSYSRVIESTSEPVRLKQRASLVSLIQYPVITAADKAMQITLGDLHGNTIKLIYMLIKEDILKISKKDYQTLCRIYTTDVNALTERDLERFKQIINLAAVEPVRLIRLIGDELCDRGQNDYFTLLVINKLVESKQAIEICLSNHSIEFFSGIFSNSRFKSRIISKRLSRSMGNMIRLINKQLISRDSIVQMFQRAYLPNLRIIAYAKTRNNKTLRFFTHAPVGLSVLESLARYFKVPLNPKSIDTFIKSLDSINLAFHQLILKEQLLSVYYQQMDELRTDYALNHYRGVKQFDLAYHLYHQDKPINDSFAIAAITWNRQLSDENIELLNLFNRQNPFSLACIHGHVGERLTIANAHAWLNLDTNLGKIGISRQGVYRLDICDTETPTIAHTNIAKLYQVETECEDTPPEVDNDTGLIFRV